MRVSITVDCTVQKQKEQFLLRPCLTIYIHTQMHPKEQHLLKQDSKQ